MASSDPSLLEFMIIDHDAVIGLKAVRNGARKLLVLILVSADGGHVGYATASGLVANSISTLKEQMPMWKWSRSARDGTKPDPTNH